MRNKIVLFLAFFLVVNSAFAQKSTEKNKSQIERGADELTNLKTAIKDLDDALMAKNTEELKRVLSDKLEMRHSNGMMETKETLLQNIENETLVYQTIENGEDLKIEKTDDENVLVTRGLDVTGLLKGEPFNVQLTTQENWVLENGDWKLIKRESKNRK